VLLRSSIAFLWCPPAAHALSPTPLPDLSPFSLSPPPGSSFRPQGERAAASAEIQTLKEAILMRKAEQERELRRRERLEKEAKDIRTVMEMRATELKARAQQLEQATTKQGALDEQLRTQKGRTDKMVRELNASKDKLSKAENELKEQLSLNQTKVAENNQAQIELRKTDSEISQLYQEIMRATKQKDGTLKKLKTIDSERDALKRERETILSQTAGLEREIEIEKREASAAKQQAEEIRAELKELEQALGKADDSTARQVAITKLNLRMIKDLEGEIGAFKSESAKQRKMLYTLEKEREKFGAEASDANAKFAAALEEVKLREMTILDLQKKIAEGDAKLKQQQNLYEAVRSDRNLYSKSLIESQDEIAEMKRKFKIMNHQIEQLKEEIQAKDQAYVKERIEHTRSDKEKETLKNELMRLKKQVAAAETSMKNYQAEVDKLNHIISEADAERFRQQREYDVAINERDILGTQLIRRNDELALLYEKIKIQRGAISQGEIAYRDRLEDLRVLRLKENTLRRELHIQRSQASQMEGLRQEVYTLQRELLQDRTKVKALSEELENPDNTHRWRKLEGSDPGTYEMVQKIQALQKRLIAKTEEVVEKDLLIQEKDKLYVELKNILARQPGPEVAEQLSIYQQSLRDKTKSMKAMASELNMYQAQVSESKYEMEKLTRELQEVKRKYYEQRRRETLLKERERQVASQRELAQMTL
jgi:chromosome segregation ATPase